MTQHCIITADFFNRNPLQVAKALLGKVLRIQHNNMLLSASIIETEAYYLDDKASHASLGYTEKRKALFMSPGTIYMYYARGGDSLNISCKGEGCAVLIKSAFPYLGKNNSQKMLVKMQELNPTRNGKQVRSLEKLCCGQTLLCRSLGLKVTEWDQQQFDAKRFYIGDVGYSPEQIIQTTRLGIPLHRDPHLLYRFIDFSKAAACTQNPLTKRSWQEGVDYFIL